jgi:hypothetical protein
MIKKFGSLKKSVGGHSDAFLRIGAKTRSLFRHSRESGNDGGGKSRESWAEVREKGATPNRDRKFGPISELTEVWKRLYSIE